MIDSVIKDMTRGTASMHQSEIHNEISSFNIPTKRSATTRLGDTFKD